MPDSALPQLWILSPTVSQRMIQKFAAQKQDLWPSGFYFLPQPFHTALVAIHQLPVNEATLWLRLMGRDGVQRKAIAELLALSPDHPLKRKTMEHLAVLQISLSIGQNLDNERREIAMNLTPVYEQWLKDTLQEGERKGRQEGRQEEGLNFVLRQLTRRIGTISPEIRDQLCTLSIAQLEDLGDALLDFSQGCDLDCWLKANIA